MSFLIFEYKIDRNEEDFVAALAFLLLKPRNEFKIVNEDEFNVEAYKKPSLARMVSYFARIHDGSTKLILQSKIDLKTDRHLIESYGDVYVGYVSKKENKASVLSRLVLWEKLEEYRQAKYQLNFGRQFFRYRYKKLEITDAELDDFLALNEKSIQPVLQWLDEHARADKEAYAALPPLIMRNF